MDVKEGVAVAGTTTAQVGVGVGVLDGTRVGLLVDVDVGGRLIGGEVGVGKGEIDVA